MIYQTNKLLKQEIREYGCYLLCILYLTRRFNCSKHLFDPKRINHLFEVAVHHDYINNNCYVLNPTQLSRLFALENNWRYYGVYEGYHNQRYTAFSKNEAILACYKHHKTHFVLLDGRGLKKRNIIYDSFLRSNTVKYGYFHSTRIYNKKEL